MILLDCCAAGTANAGGGSGVTELIAACAFNATANGVGQHSFTNALVIELTELSRKPSFSIGELYSNIFIRTQCRIPEHGRERHPAPIHLVLTQQMNFSRSIQLSARQRSEAVNEQLPTLSTLTVSESSPRQDSSTVYSNGGRGSNTSHLTGIETVSNVPVQADSMTADRQITSLEDRVPRLLFAVRIKETFLPSELSTDLFSEWLRMIPLLVEEVKVEAGFDSFSSILIVSLPIALSSYIPTDPAVMCLGPIRSRNMMLQSLTGIFSQKLGTSRNGEKSRANSNIADTRRKRLWGKMKRSSSGRSLSRATAKASPKSSPSPPSLLGMKAPSIPTPTAKNDTTDVSPKRGSLGLNPHPKMYIPAWTVRKTDIVPVDNTPNTAFHQRDDGTQEAILHDILRNKATTHVQSHEPSLALEQQREPAQNTNENSNERISGIGRLDLLRKSNSKNLWGRLRVLADVSII